MCSPALSGYRGMRDPEAAKAVGFAVHAGYNPCVYGDSCEGQRDEISNLTEAVSALFHVAFHSETANAPGLRAFVQEVLGPSILTHCALHYCTVIMVCVCFVSHGAEAKD
jgi:hypothetical protein